jgi:hypothetical protein
MEKGTYEAKRNYEVELCILLTVVIIGGGSTIIGWLFFTSEMTKSPPIAAFSFIGVVGFFTLPFIMEVKNIIVETPDYKIDTTGDITTATITDSKLTYLYDRTYIFEDKGISLLDLNKIETVKVKVSYNIFGKRLHSNLLIGSFESKQKEN